MVRRLLQDGVIAWEEDSCVEYSCSFMQINYMLKWHVSKCQKILGTKIMFISFMDTFSVVFHASLGSTIDHSHSLVLILHINFWKARVIVLLVCFLVIDTKGYAT